MTDFLTRLAQRQLGEVTTIQPRLPALYAPIADETTLRTTSETRNAPAFRAEHEPPVRIELPGSQAPGKERTPPRSLTAPASPQPQPLSREHPPARTELVHAVEAEPPGKPRILTRNEFEEPDIPELAPLNTTTRNSAGQASPREQTELTGNEPQPATAQLVVPSSKTAPAPPPRLVQQRASVHTATSRERTSLPGQVPPRLSANPDGLPGRDKDAAEAPVQVNIGRIEITAVSAPSAPRRAPAPRKPSMSLDDYLARRQRRERE